MVKLRINRSALLSKWSANENTAQVITERHARSQAGRLPALATMPMSLRVLSRSCLVLQPRPPASDPDRAGPKQLAWVSSRCSGHTLLCAAGHPPRASPRTGLGYRHPHCSCGSHTPQSGNRRMRERRSPRQTSVGAGGTEGTSRAETAGPGHPRTRALRIGGEGCGFRCSHSATHSSVATSQPGPRGCDPQT